MIIRRAAGKDVAQIAGIEKSAASPWSQALIEAELYRPEGIQIVACHRIGDILGWCCARLIRPEAELLKLTVAPEYTRRGIATDLLTRLFGLCFHHGCERIFLEVRRKNIPAVRLYTRMGFKKTALRKNYYHAPADDGVILSMELS